MSVRTAAACALALAACGGGEGDAEGRLPEARRCAIDAPPPGALHAEGTRIVDDAGRTVTLRGINTGGRAKFAPYAPFEYAEGGYDAALAAYLDRAASWGFDVLRVPFSWHALEPIRGEVDEAYLARYDALLDGAWARGMWTIVDFHQDVYAEPLCGDGFPSWTLVDPPAPRRDCPNWAHGYENDPRVQAAFDGFWSDATGVQTAFRAMWTRMVARHRARPGVIGYEPINEPHPGTGDRIAWEEGPLTTFYSEMAALINAGDPGALVFVDTTGFEAVIGQTSLRRPSGDGIVLAPHSYDAGALLGGDPDPDVHARLAKWAALGATWDAPVLIGEMGMPVDNPHAAMHGRRHMDALDQLGIGATWWEYSVSSELWNHENFSIVAADGTELPIVDELARPYPRALAGTAPVASYRPEPGRFTIEWAPAGDAPTELAVPTRWGAVRIGAEGACVAEAAGTVRVQADPGATLVRVSIERK